MGSFKYEIVQCIHNMIAFNKFLFITAHQSHFLLQSHTSLVSEVSFGIDSGLRFILRRLRATLDLVTLLVIRPCNHSLM